MYLGRGFGEVDEENDFELEDEDEQSSYCDDSYRNEYSPKCISPATTPDSMQIVVSHDLNSGGSVEVIRKEEHEDEYDIKTHQQDLYRNAFQRLELRHFMDKIEDEEDNLVMDLSKKEVKYEEEDQALDLTFKKEQLFRPFTPNEENHLDHSEWIAVDALLKLREH